jgi:hypothetical protein
MDQLLAWDVQVQGDADGLGAFPAAGRADQQ